MYPIRIGGGGMIYITGDCHGNFKRFTKKQRNKYPYEITEQDYIIVCGDFGLLWSLANIPLKNGRVER